jgi:diadenosine tetraphosphate (Ap4A) HIT family hydrolase
MPESADEFYARIAAATDGEGRLAFRPGVEEWETFPLDSHSWRLRPIGPLLDTERPRSAENAADCWCREGDGDLDHVLAKIVWRDARWVLGASRDTGIPVTLFLEPRRHGDLADMSEERAAEMGRLLVVVAAAVEALPSVGRAHVCRWGDGSAHLHWWVMGRPARVPQLLGSFLPLWERSHARTCGARSERRSICRAYPPMSATRTCASSSIGSSTHTEACRWTRCRVRRPMTVRLRATRR